MRAPKRFGLAAKFNVLIVASIRPWFSAGLKRTPIFFCPGRTRCSHWNSVSTGNSRTTPVAFGALARSSALRIRPATIGVSATCRTAAWVARDPRVRMRPAWDCRACCSAGPAAAAIPCRGKTSIAALSPA